MNRDLFLAILAMDSYNRGYGAGISGLDESGALGNATIRQFSVGEQDGWQAAGFYALAYDMTGVAGFAAGERVIAYRGTDNPSVDILQGYGIGLGQGYGPQALLAMEFYNSITGRDPTLGVVGAANVSVTGHSMGGGLAGFVGSLTGSKVAIFDPMPFDAAANQVFSLAARDDEYVHLNADAGTMTRLVYGGFLGDGFSPWAPSKIGITGSYIPAQAGNPNSNRLDSIREYLTGQSAVQGLTALSLPSDTPLTSTDYNQVGQGHAAPLIVMVIAGDGLSDDFWRLSTKYFVPALFGQDVGKAAGGELIDNTPNQYPGNENIHDPAGAMQNAIAYSAIDEGERPFGDTGIWSMFDDAGDLGKALNKGVTTGTGTSQLLTDSAGVLAKAFVQYAGKLAIGKVMGGAGSSFASGVLDLSSDGLTLTANFSADRWSHGAPHSTIIGRDELINTALATASGSSGSGSDLATGIAWQYPVSGKNAITRVVFATTNAAVTRTLAGDGGFGTSSSIFVSGDAADTITGSADNDIIAGGKGNDTIIGGAGKDILLGGEGDDILTGGEGQDFIAGGAGHDILNLGLAGNVGANISFRAIAATSAEQRTSIELVNGGDTDRIVDIEQIDLTGQSDRIALLGDVDDMGGGGPTVNMGLSPVTLGQDVVDASQSTTGIYFNMASGGVVGLDTSTNRGGTFGSLGWVPSLIGAMIEPNDIRITGANSVIGSAYSDAIFGSAGKIGSGEGFSDIHGGGGNDYLGAAGWETHLYGGDGSDVFSVGANTFIEDGTAQDSVSYCGLTIFGGVKQWWMEGSTAYWSPFTSVMNAFPVIGSSVLTAAAFFIDVATMKFASFQRDQHGNLNLNLGWGHGGTATIKNYNLDLDSGVGTAGVTVFQHERAEDFSFNNFTNYLNLALKAGFGVGLHGFDPLVLDLDGDGYELTTEANSKAYFEFDSDGFAERTGWVRGDDALLARDANGNGTIDGITELFGNQTTSGFTMLAAFDGNGDGVINASDTVYSELRVWQDANQNGVSDAGELKTLSEAGIVSINLASSAPGTATAVGGNQIVRTSSFTRADGTTGGIADVAFDISETATKWLGGDPVRARTALRMIAANDNISISMSRNA